MKDGKLTVFLINDLNLLTVVEEIKPAIEKLREERSTAYKEGMVDIKNDSTILNFEPIDKAISEVKNRGVFKNKVIVSSLVN